MTMMICASSSEEEISRAPDDRNWTVSYSVVFLFFDKNDDEKAFRDVVSTAHFRPLLNYYSFFLFLCFWVFFWLF